MNRSMISIALLFAGSSLAAAQMNTGQGGGMMDHGWGWGMGYGGGVGILLVIAIIVGIVFMMKRK